jgi:hypothetical protein
MPQLRPSMREFRANLHEYLAKAIEPETLVLVVDGVEMYVELRPVTETRPLF